MLALRRLVEAAGGGGVVEGDAIFLLLVLALPKNCLGFIRALGGIGFPEPACDIKLRNGEKGIPTAGDPNRCLLHF